MSDRDEFPPTVDVCTPGGAPSPDRSGPEPGGVEEPGRSRSRRVLGDGAILVVRSQAPSAEAGCREAEAIIAAQRPGPDWRVTRVLVTQLGLAPDGARRDVVRVEVWFRRGERADC